jgi:hypothetical protein
VIYPILVSSNEGKRIISLIGEHLLYPAIVFAFNKNSSTFNRSSVIDRLEGHVSFDVFRDTLFRNIELKENLKNNKNLSSNANLIQQQKEEIENLERMERDKKRVEDEKRKKEETEKEEKRKKEEELSLKKIHKQKCLPEEPSADNTNATHIIFRYPDGNRRVDRRFLKTDKLQVGFNLF